MTMGSKQDEQPGLFVTYQELPRSAGHPFYDALDSVLRRSGFDRFVERECYPFYAESGRPGLAPGIYFRCLLIGFFEGLDSERGIAWRVADSLSLRHFLGLGLAQTPDHSTISRTRRRLDLEVHHRVFCWVLTRLASEGLVKGKTIGVDATTLEANAALRTLVKRDDGQTYQDFLVDLAKAEGIEEPTREDIARIDRKRKKKGSNAIWLNPNDPDAHISKMKHGGTDMAHKLETAVDMETGAVVGVTLHGGTTGDTKSLDATLEMAATNLGEVRENLEAERDDDEEEPGVPVVAEQIEDIVADKGYHSSDTLCGLEESEIRSYIAEPKRDRRKWKGKQAEKEATYRNRRRTKSKRGRELIRKRGEKLERPFAHICGSGGMRRTHLRGHENILKRMLMHVAGCNLGLLMRELFGVGSPRSLQGRLAAFLLLIMTVSTLLKRTLARLAVAIEVVDRSTEEIAAILVPVIGMGRRRPSALGRHCTTDC